jgi:hypothetical protein
MLRQSGWVVALLGVFGMCKAVKAEHDKQRRDCAGQRKDYHKKNGGMKKNERI